MKRLYIILSVLLTSALFFTACDDKDPFSTATSNDDPRILNPIFPDRVNGKLPVIATLTRDANFVMKLTVTPSEFTSISWQIDGNEINTGSDIDINLKAGTYVLKIIATTTIGKSTFREGLIKVSPLAEDPWTTDGGIERIIAPGTKGRLYGSNLNKVKSIGIDNISITDITYTSSNEGEYIEYSIPAELNEGTYRITLIDNELNVYGGNTVKVSNAALIITGANRANANSEWAIKGINLNNVASLTIGDIEITTFKLQTNTELILTCPSLADGDYPLTGKTHSGDSVLFYNNESSTSKQNVTVSSETTLWEGHHYVSWELPDGNPNKTFNLIGVDTFNNLKEGTILRIYYSIATEATYHQMRTVSSFWNDLPGTGAFDFSENGVLKLELTQQMLDLIKNENGFLCVGHGYYVDRVTKQ